MVRTDYTTKANPNTLQGAWMSRYRLAHWLCDTLKNFFSDPSNIRDERLAGLLVRQDDEGRGDCSALFKVELPFSSDTRKACVTPAVFVAAGRTAYPVPLVGAGVNAVHQPDGARAMWRRREVRTVDCTVAVITESLDGTLLLAGEVEDFLLMNSLLFPLDGMVSQFTVTGSEAPARITQGEGGNAKDLYQTVINVQITGTVAWTVDTQGPLFRGLEATASRGK